MRSATLVAVALVALTMSGCTARLAREDAPEEASPPADPDRGAPRPETAPSTPAPAGASLTAYVSPKDGWKVSYPSDWNKATLAGIAMFGSPGASPDRPGASLNVVVMEVPPEAADLDAQVNQTLKTLPRLMSDFRLLSSQPDRLGGEPGWRLSYAVRQGEYRLEMTQVFALHGSKAYVVTFGTVEERAAEFAPLREPLFASFGFTDKPGAPGPAAA